MNQSLQGDYSKAGRATTPSPANLTPNQSDHTNKAARHDAQRDNPRLKAALRLAQKGKRVFPCRPSDKAPLTKNGFKDATTDARRIIMWWTRWPNALIGTPTGEASGVFVVDVDRLGALEELPHALPETFTVRSRSGGRHYYFSHGDGIRNSSGGMPSGIDIRGEGGYVIVPPSPGYTISDRAEISPAPEWLLELIREKPSRPDVGTNGECRINSTIDLDATGPIPEGGRNQTLTSIGGRLRAYGFGREEIEASLQRVNLERCSPPIEDLEEVSKIAASVSRYEPGKGSAPPDAETAAAVDEIEAAVWRSPWPRIGGKSERSLAVVLLKLARRHGRRAVGGVEVNVSHRVLALAAATSRKTVQRVLERSEWIRQGSAGNGTLSGAVVISIPESARAKCPHSTTGVPQESSGDTLRAPFSAPRLRWSAPGILRLGKSAEAVIDYLERTGGEATVEDLADYLHVSRVRDFRRRVIARLEERGIVTVAGDHVALVDNWLDALNTEREASGEIAAFKRDMERFNREREAYKNREKNVAGRAPTDADLERERLKRVQDALDALQTPRTGPAMVLKTYLAGETGRFDYVVNAVAHYYRSSAEVWGPPVRRAVELVRRAA